MHIQRVQEDRNHPVSATAAIIPTQPLGILVMEKHEDSRVILKFLLETYGCEVVCPTDANDALWLARTFIPHGVIIAVDHRDWSGFALSQQIRNIPATARSSIVALSTEWQLKEKAPHDACFDAYLLKPASVDTVLAALAGLGAISRLNIPANALRRLF